MTTLSMFVARCLRHPFEVTQHEAVSARQLAQKAAESSPLRHQSVQRFLAVAVPAATSATLLLALVLSDVLKTSSGSLLLVSIGLAVCAAVAFVGGGLYLHWAFTWNLAGRVLELTQPFSRRTDPAWHRAAQLFERCAEARKLRDMVLARDEPLRGYHLQALERRSPEQGPPPFDTQNAMA